MVTKVDGQCTNSYIKREMMLNILDDKLKDRMGRFMKLIPIDFEYFEYTLQQCVVKNVNVNKKLKYQATI